MRPRADLAERIGDGAVELDLARGHRFAAELLLQAQDAIGVSRTVIEMARQREQAEATCAVGCALGPGEQQGHITVGTRAEPLLAVEPPIRPIEACFEFDVADVRAAGLFRHELRALEDRRHVLAVHAGQEARLGFLVAVALDQQGRRIRCRDRAHQAELGLGEEVLEGVLDDRRHFLRPAVDSSAPRHAMDAEVAVADLLHLAVGGVELDPVLVEAAGIARVQYRNVTVGGAGQIVEAIAGDLAQTREVRCHVRTHAIVHVELQQGLETLVDLVEVLAVAVARNPRIQCPRMHGVIGGLAGGRGCSLGGIDGDGHGSELRIWPLG